MCKTKYVRALLARDVRSMLAEQPVEWAIAEQHTRPVDIV